MIKPWLRTIVIITSLASIISNMNKRFLVLFSIGALFANQNISAQTKLEKINHIQAVFTAINKTQNLKKIQLKNGEFLNQVTDEIGSLTGFFNNDSLVKIAEWIGLSYGVIKVDYYFETGKLVFAYAREEYFPVNDSEVNRTSLLLKFEGRYYYENSDIIAQKNSGSGMWGNTLDNVNPIFENSGKYSKLLIARKKISSTQNHD